MRCFLRIAAIGSIVTCGCLSTVTITKAPTKDPLNTTSVDGIPFYVKVAKCKQETSWLQPVYTLTLKRTTTYRSTDERAAKNANPNAKPPDPIVRTVSKTLSLPQFNAEDVRTLRALVGRAGEATPQELASIETQWNKIADRPDCVAVPRDEGALIASNEVFEVSNTSKPEAVVDYSTTYYYNARLPWLGSSQISPKFAADGTLTEGSTQVQDETLSTIMAALPISALLTGTGAATPGAATPTPTAVAPEVAEAPRPIATKETTQYELTITEEDYIHTHSRFVDFAQPCLVDQRGVTSDYALTIQSLGQVTGKKDDGNTVKVDGTVVLPKPPTKK